MLIGAVPAAVIGAAAAGASCSTHCGRDTAIGAIVFGGVGAGIGALVDARVHGYSIVDGPSLASPNALRVASPVTALDDLWLRVRQGDAIEVVTHSGQKVAGEFVQVSATSVTLMSAGGRREIASAEVRQVTRSGRRYRSGALWCGTILAGIGLFASASCSGEECGSPLFVAAFTGTAGVLWGAVIGAAIPRHAVVYQSGASSTTFRVMPMMGPDRVGVAFSAKF